MLVVKLKRLYLKNQDLTDARLAKPLTRMRAANVTVSVTEKNYLPSDTSLGTLYASPHKPVRLFASGKVSLPWFIEGLERAACLTPSRQE